jgi:hypothetical protein
MCPMLVLVGYDITFVQDLNSRLEFAPAKNVIWILEEDRVMYYDL